MKKRVIEIDACDGCPNFIYGPNACSITDAPEKEKDRYQEGRHIPDRNSIPDWCPLDTVQGLEIEDDKSSFETENEWKCKKCGSTNVEIRVWQDANTGNISGETGDDEDTWCRDCERHAGVELVPVLPPVYYQPLLGYDEWGYGDDIQSFEAYRNYNNAKKDYPDHQIGVFSGDDIEDVTFVD